MRKRRRGYKDKDGGNDHTVACASVPWPEGSISESRSASLALT